MCQISFNNTGSDDLNRKLFIIESSLGASTQKHGWGGFGTNTCKMYIKSNIPANFTTNSGDLLKSHKGVFMGHIRSASYNVPITVENAHPFTDERIFQFHNGTLTPKDDKIVVEYEVETKDDKGVVKKEKFKYSDSEIFFNKFVQVYQENKKNFIESIKKTMEEFYGKFAFTYYIAETDEKYIIRGKTADLYISYLFASGKKDAKVTGYVINTNMEVLENALILLSNLEQLAGGKEIFFSSPKELDKESIYLAGDKDITKVGEIIENPTPVKVYANTGYPRSGYYGEDWENGSGNFMGGGGQINYATTAIVDFARNVFSFCQEFSVSVSEISSIFYGMYGISIIESEPEYLKHFTKKVLETLRKKTTKAYRKRLKSACYGRFPTNLYGKYEFPWMLNSKELQIEIIQKLETTRAENEKK